MADDVDMANARADELLRRKIEHTAGKGPQAVATGRCLNCDEPMPVGARWCNAECQEDWAKRCK